jgi:hypothetical protein
MQKKRPQQDIDWAIPTKDEEAQVPEPDKAKNWFKAILATIAYAIGVGPPN